MKDKTTRLAEIYRSEKQAGGGLTSTLKKATLEKIDPRRFFNQKGLLAAVLPSLFKAYTATPDKDKGVSSRIQTAASSSLQIDALGDDLRDVKINTKLTAKNSSSLPGMAYDLNILKQNFAKFIKQEHGIKTAKKGDMFFKTASEREKEYESKFSKEKKSEAGKTVPKTGGKEAAAPGGMKGIGLGLLGSLAGSVGKGFNIAAIGIGIGGFLTGLAAGGAAAQALGGGKGIKDLLVNLGEGLSAFSGQGLLALGALLAPGMLFGASGGAGKAMSRGAGAAIGMTAIGLGIGGFMTGLAAGGSLSELVGSSSGVRDMLMALGEGLSSFSSQGLIALGSLLAPGMLFGAIAGPAGALALGGGAAVGMTMIGAGIGGFMLGLSGAAKIIEMFGGPEALKNLLVNFGQGLSVLGQVDGSNLLKIAVALPVLGASMLAFWGAQGLGSVIDAFATTGKKVLEFFGFSVADKKEKTIFEKLAESLKPLETVNGDNLSRIGQGLKDLASGMLGLAQIDKEGLKRAEAAGAVAGKIGTQVAPPTTTAPATTTPSGAPATTAPATTTPKKEEPKAQTPKAPSQAPTPPSTAPSKAPQTSAQVPSGGELPMDYKSYAAKIAEKESGSDYKKVNTLGYLGKYQMGALALQDMGLVKKGTTLKGLDDNANWNIEGGKQAFLNNPQLQEDTMLRYTKQNFAALSRMGVITKSSTPQDVAGYLAASHLLGPGGAKQLSQGKAGTDAYGTSSATYFKVGAATQTGAGGTTAVAAAPTTPSTGSKISTASSSVADGKMAAMAPKGGNVVVDNSKKTTVASSGGGGGGGTATAYDDDLIRTMISTASA